MSLMETIKSKAKANKRHILLPEGTEERTVQAAVRIAAESVADVSLLGDAEKIRSVADKFCLSLDGVGIVDQLADPAMPRYARMYYEMRKDKGLSETAAATTMKNPLFFACMMIRENRADGMVAGALSTTGETLRPGLQIIRMADGISVVSSCFVMEIPNKAYGDNGVMIFADCAVNPVLTAEQLAECAYCSALTAKEIAGIAEPKVAMLSFSTKGSASHETVDKVIEATNIARERYPELLIDGELQMDAATVESVGQSKSPGSKVAGRANVFIFPSLDAGNIAYKAVQRFAGAEAIGPILQGIAKPVNDLSRGCSIEDIVNTAAVVCCQQ
ncbi:MAG: phosphate acetyltransferase [Clostridia bacterium]|nr:phosphate acetyltransferase [Clostridia bacterium]